MYNHFINEIDGGEHDPNFGQVVFGVALVLLATIVITSYIWDLK